MYVLRLLIQRLDVPRRSAGDTDLMILVLRTTLLRWVVPSFVSLDLAVAARRQHHPGCRATCAAHLPRKPDLINHDSECESSHP